MNYYTLTGFNHHDMVAVVACELEKFEGETYYAHLQWIPGEKGESRKWSRGGGMVSWGTPDYPDEIDWLYIEDTDEEEVEDQEIWKAIDTDKVEELVFEEVYAYLEGQVDYDEPDDYDEQWR